jgi:hypothetical protein
MGDPFLNGIVPVYDGNPAISFSKWSEHLKDVLELMTKLNEAQKLSRLRISLKGLARIEFNAADPAPRTLEEALVYLKGKFENDHTRAIARQALSMVKQAPGEKIHEFANRLDDAVRAVLVGENEESIKKRLLDEFLDRMLPDIQFEVKGARPESYSAAFELAQHFELLLAETKRQSGHAYMALAEKVEALTVRSLNEKMEYVHPNRRERSEGQGSSADCCCSCHECCQPPHRRSRHDSSDSD